MRQTVRTAASKFAGGTFTVIVVLGIVAFWAAAAVLFWSALKPYRLLVVDLWELIPAGARFEVGLGLGIAGGVLLILFVILGFVGNGRPTVAGGTSRSTYIGLDADGADADVSGL